MQGRPGGKDYCAEPDTGGANDSIYSCQCRWKATLCPYDRRQMPGF